MADIDWAGLTISTAPLDRDQVRTAIANWYGWLEVMEPAVVFCESIADMILKVCEIHRISQESFPRQWSFEVHAPALGGPQTRVVDITDPTLSRIRPHELPLRYAFRALISVNKRTQDQVSWRVPQGTEFPPGPASLMAGLDQHARDWQRYSDEFPKGWKIMKERGFEQYASMKSTIMGGWRTFSDYPNPLRALGSQMAQREMSPAEEQLSQVVLGILPLQYFCFVLERPEEIHFNNLGRLSAYPGYAVKFRDGSGIYVANGVHYPRVSGQLTIDKVRTQPNAEVRRVMMETYGITQYLADVKAKLFDDDPEWGKLWRIPVEVDRRPDMYVQVKNSTPEPDGTFKDYFLRVPPHMQKSREAVAWTFNLNSETYAPLRQT